MPVGKRLNKDGTFQSWQWYDRDVYGKPAKKSGFKKQSEAKEAYDIWLKRQGKKKNLSGRITFEVGKNLYLDNMKLDGAKNTISRCESAYNVHILPFFNSAKYADKCVTDLEREDINEWIKSLIDKGVSKK